MLYSRRSFTLPASSQPISQRAWDFALMDREEFLEKYGQEAEEYAVKSGTTESSPSG